MVYPLNVKEEQIIRNQLQSTADKINQMSVLATPELAARVGDIYRNNPQLPAGVVLSSAQANLDPTQVAPIANKTAVVLNTPGQNDLNKSKKNFFQRTYDYAKLASRYTFGALESSTQLVQNAASQVFGNNPDGIEGWFASTDLGSLMKNGDVAGDGFFIGGEAKQLQTQRVQNFRGKTTGGHAWTIGRGMAGLVFEEQSKAYNLMSGFFDAAVAVATPILPGFKTGATAINVAAEAGKGGDVLKGVDQALSVIRGKGTRIATSDMTADELVAARSAAGLLGNTVNIADANKFLGTTKGMKLVDRLVEANTTEDVIGLLGENIYPSTIQNIRNAKTVDEMQEVLVGVLGVAQKGITRTIMPGTKRFTLSNARRVNVVNNLVGTFENSRYGRIGARAFEKRPSQKLVDFSSDNDVDVRRTLNDLNRWLKVSLTDQTKRVKFLDQALDAMTGPAATPTARRALKKEFNDLLKESLIKSGVDESVTRAVIDGHVVQQTAINGFHAGLDAQLFDGNFFTGVHAAKGTVQNGAFGGPLMQSELADFSVVMPDIAQVRALTGRINNVWRKKPKPEFGPAQYVDENIDRLAKAGELRFPLALIKGFQETIFRPLITATGGFSLRNLAEGQFSLTLSSKPVTSIFRHPLQHMQWSAHSSLGSKIGRKGVGDIMGNDFAAIEDAVKGSMKDYQHAVGVGITSHYRKNPSEILRRGQRTGQFNRVIRSQANAKQVIEAHADQIGRMNADPVMRQIAEGLDDDGLIDFIRNTDDGKKWFRDQQDYHINGRSVFDKDKNSWSSISVDLNDEHNLRLLLDNYKERLSVVVGNHGNLKIAIAKGQMEPITIDAQKEGWTAADRGQNRTITVGKRVIAVKVDKVNENIVRPFAFERGEATKALNDALARPSLFNDPALAQELTHETRVAVRADGSRITEQWDATFDRFHGFMSQKPTAYLERAPAFKQRYFATAIDELVTSLSPTDLDRLITRVETAALKNGISPSDYVGDSPAFLDMTKRLFTPSRKVVGDRWQRILDLQANPNKLKGTLSLEDVDQFAKGQALDDLKKMLYDASERNNLTDVSRIVVPFGQAQAEFFRRLGRVFTVETGGVPLPNLAALRKTQLIVEGGRDADPDGDGRGIFYTDPQTGEWSFDYPFSEGFNHLATSIIGGGPGVKSTFQAPIKGALMGFDVRPGIGPVAQIAASVVLQDSPKADFIKSVIMPYGETDLAKSGGVFGAIVDSTTPSYAKKIMSAIFDSPNSATVYGNTYMETYQALATSTDYDLTTPIGRDQLAQDAVWKAKFLTVMRGLGQFFGPSRPTNKMSVETKKGDVFVNVLSMELRKMQLEDYDSAIPRFLDIYGDQVFVYLSGKTKAVYGGLQASKQFGDFERANKDLFRKYKGVAGYFVEGGTDLDWQVYTRQLATGQRERLSPDETLAAAQKYVAYSQYRQVQDLIGPYPNGEQKEYLATFREYLGEQYPGFTSAVYDPNKMKNDIKQLQDAVQDPNLADNQVAIAARLYLQTRDAVLAEAANRGLTTIDRSKNTSDLRGYLREYAVTLKEQYPDFARLYDRLLLQEVDE